MKLFLDTNIVIDVIANRESFVEDSRIILNLCETGKAEGIISALTLCTISYVLRKFATPGMMRTKLRDLRNILTPIDLSVSLLDKAIASSITDFEDAVQFYTAAYSDADVIITRNIKHFPQDNIPVLTPTEFLALNNSNNSK
ncbi:MAG: PIN domain-containing protein [Victivallales bacterium]|nr:PIN domain-containing protein [Victivallales bacterium]